MDAALETLRDEGFAGSTARAIAQRGGFNQALIFYHFGSVSSLLLEAFRRSSVSQVSKYREPASVVSSRSERAALARRLLGVVVECGSGPAAPRVVAQARRR